MKHALLHGAAPPSLENQSLQKPRIVYLTAEAFIREFTKAARMQGADKQRLNGAILNPGGTATPREWKKRGKPVRPA